MTTIDEAARVRTGEAELMTTPANPPPLDYSQHPAARLKLRLALEAQIKRARGERGAEHEAERASKGTGSVKIERSGD